MRKRGPGAQWQRRNRHPSQQVLLLVSSRERRHRTETPGKVQYKEMPISHSSSRADTHVVVFIAAWTGVQCRTKTPLLWRGCTVACCGLGLRFRLRRCFHGAEHVLATTD